MTAQILKLEALSKDFRSHWTFMPRKAVRDVSLEVYAGDAFGFLGHNGAGKTTTIKCILGLISKSAGKVLFEGEELRNPEQRAAIGYLPEQPYFYDHLSVRETLSFFAALHGLRGKDARRAIEESLELVGLTSRVKSPIRALSKGLQQRLGFAQAILNRPRLLLLDEPFSGLDPLGRHEFKNLIRKLNREGTTVFLSSHILADVEDICSRVSIMAQGTLHKVFAIKEIPQLFGESYEVVLRVASNQQELVAAMLNGHCTVSREQHGAEEVLTARVPTYGEATELIARCAESQLRLEEFRRCCPSLEEIFVQVTGEKYRVVA